MEALAVWIDSILVPQKDLRTYPLDEFLPFLDHDGFGIKVVEIFPDRVRCEYYERYDNGTFDDVARTRH